MSPRFLGSEEESRLWKSGSSKSNKRYLCLFAIIFAVFYRLLQHRDIEHKEPSPPSLWTWKSAQCRTLRNLPRPNHRYAKCKACKTQRHAYDLWTQTLALMLCNSCYWRQTADHTLWMSFSLVLQNRRREDLSSQRRTVYDIYGQRMCQSCFAAEVQISPININRHARNIWNELFVTADSTVRESRKKMLLRRTWLCYSLKTKLRITDHWAHQGLRLRIESKDMLTTWYIEENCVRSIYEKT